MLCEMRTPNQWFRNSDVMPSWVITILLSVATTAVTGLFVLPRLEARNRRIQAGHIARDRLATAVLSLLASTARLQVMPVPPEGTETMRARLTGERTRWLEQIDEATRTLVDTMEQSTLGFPSAMRLRDLAVGFVGHARMVWISERPEEDRVRIVGELAALVQGIFFAAWWRGGRRLKLMSDLLALLQRLENGDA